MLYDAAIHVLNFDLSWLISLILDNLFWVFVFACLGTFIYGKNPIAGGIFVAIYLYATFDFATALDWGFGKGLFWAPIIVFVGKIFYSAIFGNTKHASKMPWFASILFYLVLVLTNWVA